jgi:hypothetical protein
LSQFISWHRDTRERYLGDGFWRHTVLSSTLTGARVAHGVQASVQRQTQDFLTEIVNRDPAAASTAGIEDLYGEEVGSAVKGEGELCPRLWRVHAHQPLICAYMQPWATPAKSDGKEVGRVPTRRPRRKRHRPTPQRRRRRSGDGHAGRHLALWKSARG